MAELTLVNSSSKVSFGASFSPFLAFLGCPIDADHKSKRWCSTKVDYNGNHVVKQNQYGHCSSSCPVDNSNSGSGGYGNNNNNNHHHGNQSKNKYILYNEFRSLKYINHNFFLF